MSVIIKTEHLHLSVPMRTRLELELNKLAHLLPHDSSIHLSLRIDAREVYEGMLCVRTSGRDMTCVEFGPHLIHLVTNLNKRLLSRLALKSSPDSEAI